MPLRWRATTASSSPNKPLSSFAKAAMLWHSVGSASGKTTKGGGSAAAPAHAGGGLARAVGACPKMEHPDDPNRPPWVPDHEFAGFATQLATQYASGTILVIGANEGKVGTDPSFDMLRSKQAEHLHKVFVEPVPYLFKRLEQNIKTMARASAWNVAVTNQSAWLNIFCFGLDADHGPGKRWPDKLRGSSWVPSVQREGRSWWSQICSLDRERLYKATARDFSRTPREALDEFVTKARVRGVTVPTLLEMTTRDRPVRSVQIDVEGFDDIVLKALPLGKRHAGVDFRPASIVFEHNVLSTERVLNATDWLRRRGCWACREGQNIVALAVPN